MRDGVDAALSWRDRHRLQPVFVPQVRACLLTNPDSSLSRQAARDEGMPERPGGPVLQDGPARVRCNKGAYAHAPTLSSRAFLAFPRYRLRPLPVQYRAATPPSEA